jgi:hypothetical protein
MKRYVKAVLGGVLALLAAFGWTVTLFVAISLAHPRLGEIWGFDPAHAPAVYIIVLSIFSVGFYLAFHAAYGSNSK